MNFYRMAGKTTLSAPDVLVVFYHNACDLTASDVASSSADSSSAKKSSSAKQNETITKLVELTTHYINTYIVNTQQGPNLFEVIFLILGSYQLAVKKCKFGI